MTALIVGGDYVEPLKREIRAHGHANVEHWDGRKAGFTKKAIPGGTRLIVILIDYISHSLLIALKRQASRHNVPLVFCRRSMNDLRGKLGYSMSSESRPGKRAIADPRYSGYAC